MKTTLIKSVGNKEKKGLFIRQLIACSVDALFDLLF